MGKLRPKIGRSHILIPDLQVHRDMDFSHLEHIGNYCLDAQPDVIIQIGDWFDLPSLSSYDLGHAAAEGKRLVDDLAAGRASIDLFLKPIRKWNRGRRKKYLPRLVFTEGNHCDRLRRLLEENPRLIGMLPDDPFGFKSAGFEVHPFLKIVKIDMIEYVHFVVSGLRGQPCSSAAQMLRIRHSSVSCGHAQKIDLAYHGTSGQIGLIAGAAYNHHHNYTTAQGDTCRRGIWRKNEVQSATGVYDPMFVSNSYLKRKWS